MIHENEVGNEIIEGTKEVFSTMLMVELSDHKVVIGEKCEIGSNLTSMIGLGGTIRGVLAVHCPQSTALAMTGAMLGMEVTDLNEDVKDAVAEIVNMVAGNLKVSFAKADIGVELAIPTSIVGDSFSVSGIADAQRVTIHFMMDNNHFWVELMYVVNT